MAELLIQFANIRPDHVAGEVISVRPDGFGWSDLERRQFIVVSCSALTTAQAESIYLRNGVPAVMKQAAEDADAAFRSAVLSSEQDPVIKAAAVASAKAARDAAIAAADQKTWPPRLRHLDVTSIPTAVRNRVRATWDTINANRAAARAEARTRVLAFLDSKFGPLTPEEQARTTAEWGEWLARRWKAARDAGATEAQLGRIDALREALFARSRAGWRAIEDVALAAIPVPATVTVTLTQLNNATLTVDAQAFHLAHGGA